MSTNQELHQKMIAEMVKPSYESNRLIGLKVAELYTAYGLPVDMALKRLDVKKEDIFMVMIGVCSGLIDHLHKSGATDKAIKRQQDRNIKIMTNIVKNSETGLY